MPRARSARGEDQPVGIAPGQVEDRPGAVRIVQDQVGPLQALDGQQRQQVGRAAAGPDQADPAGRRSSEIHFGH